jgi:hypothetical protein
MHASENGHDDLVRANTGGRAVLLTTLHLIQCLEKFLRVHRLGKNRKVMTSFLCAVP